MNHPLALSLRPALHEVFWVGRQQLLACVFGILLLAGMLLTRSWDSGVAMARADFLFLYAFGLQLILIFFRFEHRREVAVILVFHVLATLMEWFKTSPTIGSWRYPDEGAIFRVYQVPLFAGFLYSSVGSYLARAWVYPDQESGWRPVSVHKFWAWYLLMTLSFVLVSLVNLPAGYFRRGKCGLNQPC